MRVACYFIFIFLLLTSCSNNVAVSELKVKFIETPTSSSGQSRLVTGESGKVYLSWIEYEDTDTFTLMYAQLSEGDTWSQPLTITQGSDWFINWADFPSLAVFSDGQLAAHWLQMRDVGTYDYDVHISQSQGGSNWSHSFIPHRDSISAEHGFASMIPVGPESMMVSWLDGRNTVTQEDGETNEQHGHSGGAMTLRTATFDKRGVISNEFELDNRICDCCQTDMALSDQGPLVVYRDRSDDEIRDISIVRYLDNKWTSPKSIYNDEWHINGCPVNGPAVDAIGNNVAVAWYTAAQGIPKVQLAISTDSGANFDLPIIIDSSNPLGRVDTKWINKNECLVTWLKADGENAMIQATIVHLDGTTSSNHELIKTKSSRKSGFPILTRDSKGMVITWTEVLEEHTIIRTARLII